MFGKGHKYQTKRDYVVELLREAIAAGQIKPGERLRQEVLAEDLGISQTPVREALRKLEDEGILSHVPHKGVKVAEISLADAEEMYRIRGALESLAAKLVVEDSGQDHLFETVDKLEKVVEAMGSLVKRNRLKGLVKLNTEFHMTICAAARSPRLHRITAGLWSTFPRDALWLIPGMAEALITEHVEILEAIKEGDADKAAKAVSDHCANSARALAAYVKGNKIV